MNRSPPAPLFSFILQSEYPLNALILATEALRIANQNSGRQLFEWCLASLTGDDVRASNGMWLPVDCRFDRLPKSDYYLVFEGNLPTQNNSPELLTMLRKAHRSGATLIGIDTGAFALAQADLIHEATAVHWEAAPTFHEQFSQLPTSNSLYRIDGRVASCAGGVATLDLMLELMKRHYGEALTAEVANALVHQPRPGGQPQRADNKPGRDKSLSERLLELMEKNLDFPLTSAEVAAKLHVSTRTLERHCRRHFGHTPMRLYLGIRLQGARNFLFYADYSIEEVALAYGFSSPAVFSRTFKDYFGQTPSDFRNAFRNRQRGTRLPEIRRLYATRKSR